MHKRSLTIFVGMITLCQQSFAEAPLPGAVLPGPQHPIPTITLPGNIPSATLAAKASYFQDLLAKEGFANDNPPASPGITTESPLQLQLNEAIALTLINQKQVEVVELNVIEEGGVAIARAEPFDPVFAIGTEVIRLNHMLASSSTGISDITGGTAVVDPVFLHNTFTGNQQNTIVTLTKKARLGTRFTVQGEVTRNYDPVQGNSGNGFRSSISNISFRITQPLLRDFRYGVEAMQETAERYFYQSTYYAALLEISDRVRQTISFYWAVAAAKQRVIVQMQAVKNSEDLLVGTQKLIASEELPRSDILQVEAQLTTELFLLEQEQQALFEAVQNLNFYTGMDLNPRDTEFLSYKFDELPGPQISWTENEDILPDVVEHGLVQRYDIRALQNTISGSIYLVKGAKNAILPSLDVYTEANSINAEVGRRASSPGGMLSRRRGEMDITVGAEFSMPFWNDGPEGRLQTQASTLRQQQLQLDRLNDFSVSNIRQTFARLMTLERQLKLDAKLVEENTRLVSTELVKLKGGVSTLFVFIDFQNRLTAAKLNQVNDLLAYQQNLALLLFQTGDLLEGNDENTCCGPQFNVTTDEEEWLTKIQQ